MSLPKTITINCPQCNKPFKVTVFASLNSDYSDDITERVISGDLFDAKCPKCGFKTHLAYDFLYHDLKHNAWIWVIHKNSSEYASKVADARAMSVPSQSKRIVNDVHGLREKVACLENNRDDRIIELCKEYTIWQLKADNPNFDVRNAFYATVGSKEFILLYDYDDKSMHCELPAKLYDELHDVYINSIYATQFNHNYPIVDSKWAKTIFEPILNLMYSNWNSEEFEDVSQEPENSIDEIKQLICPQCNNQLPEDSAFCHYCGHKVEKPTAENVQKSTVEEVQEPAPLKCNKCNNILPDDSEFCHYCGNKVGKQLVEEKPQVSVTKPPKTKKWNKGNIVFAICCIIVAIGACIAAALIFTGITNNDNSSTTITTTITTRPTTTTRKTTTTTKKTTTTTTTTATTTKTNQGSDPNPDPPHTHREVIDAAVAPTCKETGLTEGSHCSVCGDTLHPQETIPIIDHFEGDWIVDKKATRTESGHKHTECTMCNQWMSEETIPQLPPYSMGLEYDLIGDEYSVSDIGTCTDTDIVIPSTYNEKPVTVIGNKAFEGCSSVTNITIPNSVQIIADKAFSNCSSLTSISIPNSVVSIGADAFQNCSSLKSIKVPDSVRAIGERAFNGCSSLESMNLPFVGVSKNNSHKPSALFGALFGSAQYEGSVKVTQWYLSNQGIVCYVPTTLKTVTIRNGDISEAAFYGCYSIKNIVMGASVTNIERGAFYDCDSLTSIEIPASVNSISERAFYSCKSLMKVTIPASITSIGESAFEYCSSLANITFKGTVEQWNSIDFSSDWSHGILATEVICSNGTVSLE